MQRTTLRATAGKLAVAGTAALATLVSIAPTALATDDDIAPDTPAGETTAPEPETPAVEKPAAPPVEEKQDDAPPAPEVAEPETPADEVVGELEGPTFQPFIDSLDESAVVEYAPQQFSVSARPDANGYYRNGGSSALHEFQIVITDAEGNETTETCQTDLAAYDGTTASCLFNGDTYFQLEAGATAVVTQSLNVYPSDMAKSTESFTINPVQVEPDTDPILQRGRSITTTDLVFTLPGKKPDVGNYSTTIDVDDSYSFDPIGGDSVGDPSTTIEITTSPAHGTAVLVDPPAGDPSMIQRASSGHPTILYTPNPGYEGTDAVGYTITNTNGSTTGTANLQVGEESEVLEPNFGLTKFYISASVDQNGYYPPGSTPTTAGSTIKIVKKSANGQTKTAICTTQDNGGGDSFCPTPSFGAGDTDIQTLDIGPFSFSVLGPGVSLAVTQTGAAPGMQITPGTQQLGPCEDSEVCMEEAEFENLGSVVPVPRGDSVTTKPGEPVIVDVLANDASDDPDTQLTLDGQPANGSTAILDSSAPDPIQNSQLARAQVLSAVGAGTRVIRYVPASGFSGTDTFRYRVTNGNGSRLGTVTVTVSNGQVVSSDDDAVLPDTGGSDLRLLGLGGLLAAAGAGAVAGSRRRRGQPVA